MAMTDAFLEPAGNTDELLALTGFGYDSAIPNSLNRHVATMSRRREVLLANVGAPGMPVLKPMRMGTSNMARRSTPQAGWRLCQPPTSAGNITHPISGPNANHRVSCFALWNNFIPKVIQVIRALSSRKTALP
jgi:hypothetical protein